MVFIWYFFNLFYCFLSWICMCRTYINIKFCVSNVDNFETHPRWHEYHKERKCHLCILDLSFVCVYLISIWTYIAFKNPLICFFFKDGSFLSALNFKIFKNERTFMSLYIEINNTYQSSNHFVLFNLPSKITSSLAVRLHLPTKLIAQSSPH